MFLKICPPKRKRQSAGPPLQIHDCCFRTRISQITIVLICGAECSMTSNKWYLSEWSLPLSLHLEDEQLNSDRTSITQSHDNLPLINNSDSTVYRASSLSSVANLATFSLYLATFQTLLATFTVKSNFRQI